MSLFARCDHYRGEADRVRELARAMTWPDIRNQMEKVALEYEALAKLSNRLAAHEAVSTLRSFTS